jgi:hypothetical protein
MKASLTVDEIMRGLEQKAALYQKTENYVEAPLAQKDEYELADFLQYYDEAFFINAYQAILKRPPDASFLSSWMMLRQGLITKKEIVYNLRFSMEGRIRGTKIHQMPSLGWAIVNRLGHRPLLGYGVRLIKFLLLLPIIVRNQRALETRLVDIERENRKLKKRLKIQDL